MGKSSRRKRERRENARATSPLGLEFNVMANPFGDIPRDRLTRVIAGFGKEQAEQFGSTTTAVLDLLSRVDPVGLLACLTVYGITDFMDEGGLITPMERTRLQPAHVELAQMMALSIAPDVASATPVTPRDVQSMFELLPKWSNQFHWKRLSQVEK